MIIIEWQVFKNDSIVICHLDLWGTLGSCPSLVFVWSFLLLLVLCPSGIHEILGTKVGSPGTTPRNAVAIGREFCRQPSAFCLQNGYSRKIPDQFHGLCPLTWLPRRRAKNCLYPKGRSIKKLHTKETDNKKNVWPLSGGRLLSQQVSLKPMPTEYKKAKGSCYDMLCSIIYRRGV